MDANPCVKKKICCCSLIKWKYLNWNIWERKIIFNLKEIEIGIVDRGLEVALSDCPNILSYLPIRMDLYWTYNFKSHSSFRSVALSWRGCGNLTNQGKPDHLLLSALFEPSIFGSNLLLQTLTSLHFYLLRECRNIQADFWTAGWNNENWICVYTLKLVHTLMSDMACMTSWHHNWF